ncbi:ribulokinase [Staphylococcus sp. IVB6240]|uniref:ribulokinase n=1 Tax=Staphylococcus sp. IVB6240 TaxID=2989771 RepID=UPI0021D3A1B1|nr:ribulokinase [Staphylococcus sp. IVB6240]UXR70976.1 ribulokinase [Staphylococcus sp. IVB6240]
MTYSIGIDYGTGSGRVFLVQTKTGKIVSQYIKPYTHGTIDQELFGEKLPHGFSLQNANDYLEVLEEGIPHVLKEAEINSNDVLGIGIDFTASTVIFVDKDMNPIHNKIGFEENPHAYVKLWKHHGAEEEANLLFNTAIKKKKRWLGNYGYNVSSEWMIPKIMEVMNKAPEVMDETFAIMEAGDWIVNKLTNQNIRSNCGIGFKAFWEAENGFHYDLFDEIDKNLSKVIRDKVDTTIINIGDSAGHLSSEIASKLGLSTNTQVSPFIIDAHSSLLGIGAEKERQMTMVMGTSTCHLMLNKKQKRIPGISGSVKGAIIPDLYAYEAGQSAVGDLFEYAVKQAPKSYIDEAESRNISIHHLFEEKAAMAKPGESGLIALDWHNGNRSVLSDSSLRGSIFGLTLHTKPEEIYRAYLEATAFGAKMIMQQYEDWGLHVEDVFACSGIPKRNKLLMDIYANVLNKKIVVIDSEYTPAIGSAVLGAVVGGAYETIQEATQNMKEPVLYEIEPDTEKVERYEVLFKAYKELHDIHGYKKARIMRSISKLYTE